MAGEAEISFEEVMGPVVRPEPASTGGGSGGEISFAEAADVTMAAPVSSKRAKAAPSVPGAPIPPTALTATRRAFPGGGRVPEPVNPNADLTAAKRLPGNITATVKASLRSLGSSIDQAVADSIAIGEASSAEQLASGKLSRTMKPGEHKWTGLTRIVRDVAAQNAAGASDRAFGAEMQSGRAARQTRQHLTAMQDAIPSDAGPIERTIQSGLSSAAITVPIVTAGALVPGAQVPALVALGGMEGLQRYGELRSLRVPEGEAAISAGLIGGLAGFTEATPMGALAKKSPFMQKAAEFLVTDIMGENLVSVATILEDWNLQLRDDVTIKDINKALLETTGATIVGAGAQLSVSGLMNIVIDKANSRAQLRHPDVKTPSQKEMAKQITKSAEAMGEQVGNAEVDISKGKPVTVGGKPAKPRVRLKPGQTVISPEEAGIAVSKTVAELPTKVPAKPTTVNTPVHTVDEDTGQHTVALPSGTGELLAQENGNYLQVKRADVVPGERGKGNSQAMMATLADIAVERGLTLASDFSVSPDAQRVYEALSKKGFEVKENPNSPGVNGSKVSNHPRIPVYEVSRPAATATITAEPTPAAVAQATQIFASGPTLDALPGGLFVKGKLTAWYDEIIRTINPEALGPKAKMAAAVLANKIAESMNKDATNHGYAKNRIRFWEKMSGKAVLDFISFFESGAKFKNPVFQKAADNIRQRNQAIFTADQNLGIKYDPVDNYLYHVFKDGDKLAAHFEAKYGAKWGDPKFTKDRAFDFYAEAIKAGFVPQFTNPEEIMLARQHASDIAEMRVTLLRDLETYGLAKKKTKNDPDSPKGVQSNYRRSPTGEGYWVDAQADAILHNAFDTKSLWAMSGLVGDTFRGAMFLKNTIVPVKLALSLFHPLHVATIDNATGMVRASKALLSGQTNPIQWLGQMIDAGLYGSKGIPFKGVWDNPKLGGRLLRAYQGKIDAASLTGADLQAFQYMSEGGMIPEMSVQYKTGAIDSLRKAIQQTINEPGIKRTEGAVKTVWYLPFAVIQSLQKPMFEIWIPSLKIASYLKDVQTAIKVDPTLITDKGRRLLAFRKLAKSIDNRYGEMAYNTLFWNRTVKDLAVANTLSLGWNLGFIREYGGGLLDVGQSVTSKGSLSQKAKKGLLDRPLFVSFYTIQSLMYGGLMTYLLGGEPPKEMIDYLYPKNGNAKPNGDPERVNTMFYPREFAAIAKHIEHEGLAPGLWHIASNKASGVVGMVKQWATGVNWMDQEIRDPNSPWHEKLRQTIKATFIDLEPISMKATRVSERTAKDVILNVSGFSPAPKYAEQSHVEGEISTLYRKYYAAKQTPYETALLSNDRRELSRLYDKGDIEGYGELLETMLEKYQLTAKEQQRLAQNVLKRGQDFNPYISMFEKLPWQRQKRLLDKMTEEERAEYLPSANREHLRFSYEEPAASDD
jgi:hypothetical protein